MPGQDDGRSGTKVDIDDRAKQRDKTLQVGDTYFTTNDNSYNDNTSVHIGDNHNTTINYGVGDRNLVLERKCLEEKISRGAGHDSAERGPEAPKCHEGTREVVRLQMLDWVDRHDDEQDSADVLWLSGPAGGGKTAIAGSVADECHAQGSLAGSFFLSSFAGKPDRCSKEYIVSTLAYQFLHTTIPGLREEILLSIDANPSVFDKRMDQQLDILVLGPLRRVGQALGPSAWPKAVIIDGVDECSADNNKNFKTEQERQRSRDDNHREILSTLIRASNDPSFPFRLIITSRPERAIKQYFASLPDRSVKEIFLDDKYDPQADIELYLRAMFKKIGRERHLPNDWYSLTLPLDWPHDRTRDVALYLAQESSGQFIYAATVIRYVQDGTSTPIEKLRHILSWQRPAGSEPLAVLDALYALILRSSPMPLLSAKWIRAINCLSRYRKTSLSWYIKALLESSPGELDSRIGNLASLVGLSSHDGETRFVFYHKSLLDFLESPARSGGLCIDNKSVLHPFLDDRHYQVLKNRGPQVPLPTHLLNNFLHTFCDEYVDYYSHRLRYITSDVDWWCSHVDFEGRKGYRPRYAFEKVHQGCHWYHSHSSCTVWRKGILRHCRAKGWRVPTWKDLLEDRFKKIDYWNVEHSRLRPPPHRAPTDADTGSDSKNP